MHEDVLTDILGAAQQFLDEGEYGKLIVQANRLIIVSSIWSNSVVDSNVAVALRLACQDVATGAGLDGKLDLSQKQDVEKLIGALRGIIQSPSNDPLAPWDQIASFKRAFWSKRLGE